MHHRNSRMIQLSFPKPNATERADCMRHDFYLKEFAGVVNEEGSCFPSELVLSGFEEAGTYKGIERRKQRRSIEHRLRFGSPSPKILVSQRYIANSKAGEVTYLKLLLGWLWWCYAGVSIDANSQFSLMGGYLRTYWLIMRLNWNGLKW